MKKDNLRQEGQEFKGDLGYLVKPSPRERRGRGGRVEDSNSAHLSPSVLPLGWLRLQNLPLHPCSAVALLHFSHLACVAKFPAVCKSLQWKQVVAFLWILFLATLFFFTWLFIFPSVSSLSTFEISVCTHVCIWYVHVQVCECGRACLSHHACRGPRTAPSVASPLLCVRLPRCMAGGPASFVEPHPPSCLGACGFTEHALQV